MRQAHCDVHTATSAHGPITASTSRANPLELGEGFEKKLEKRVDIAKRLCSFYRVSCVNT